LRVADSVLAAHSFDTPALCKPHPELPTRPFIILSPPSSASLSSVRSPTACWISHHTPRPSEPRTSPAALGRVCVAVSAYQSLRHSQPPSGRASVFTTTTMTNKSYLAFLDNNAAADMLARTTVPGLSALPSLIPHRVRRKWRATKSRIRSRQTPTSSIASLETSFSPSDTLRSLRTHSWSIYDAQYLFLAILAIFSLSVSEAPGPFAKTFVATLLMTGLCLPITRQFLLPLLPTLTWLFLFNSCKYVLLPFHLILPDELL
jgi:hypothetical protein